MKITDLPTAEMLPKRGKTASRHRMRCGRPCNHRFALPRSPIQYKRPVRCPACGSTRVFSKEAEERRRVATQGTCRCIEYPFPHRAGSLAFCHRNPAWDRGWQPSEDEIMAHRRLLDTPRSACC